MVGLPSISPQASTEPTHTVSTKILVDGSDLTKKPGGLLSMSVQNELNRIPSANIVWADGAVEKGTFSKSSSVNFAPGKMVDIQLGYQNQTENVFKGLIVRHRIKASAGSPSALELECKDAAIHLTLTRKSRYFVDQKDKSVFQEIIGEYKNRGVTIGTLDDTEAPQPELVQYDCTDWDFLVMRAEANGLVVMVSNGKISIVKPAKAAKADFEVTWGTDLLDLEAEMDVRTHYADISTSSWDAVNSKMATEKGSGNTGAVGSAAGALNGLGQAAGAAGNALGIDTGVEDTRHQFPEVFYQSEKPQLFHGGDMDTKALGAWAKGQQKRAELSQVRGRVQVRGRHYVPLHTLALKKVAGRFNGSHLISGVLHQVHSGTWEVDIQFGLSAQTFAETKPYITSPEAGGLLPAIQGLHVGIVTKIEGDTVTGGHRIKVKIPFIADQGRNSEGIWARQATISAGDKRGSVFRPEIKDEVILGFINNDPNDAIILGMLHSKTKPAPIDAKDKNLQQGYFAKKGMSLLFDDEKKSIELKTQEGYSILVSESPGKIELKDKSGNTVTLSESGISLVGKSNISIEAEGEVSIKGKTIQLNKPGP
ncbi:hypothetical protein GCM10010967_56760 [Dyadobacter beijingensis]|uniref:Gp5/Type VI secretion system Vgr protein OB-fold domain-containing protein n=1 Tax=Dyadobacter beijingensis TaxID=365489 RepID=A0ABQ2IJY3_9BACT|nr:type VI secretion system tip protein VgrG [Dyadobacter beijingensis]GGN13299.1 hypothetical protein GCM10010967_56760 [Dyadobacter beijingensis]